MYYIPPIRILIITRDKYIRDKIKLEKQYELSTSTETQIGLLKIIKLKQLAIKEYQSALNILNPPTEVK